MEIIQYDLDTIDPISIVTHDGKYHADEIMACAILKYIFGIDVIVRTRDIELINYYYCKGYYLIDVGQEYDGDGKFDHHQKGFDERFYPSCMTPMSSCGLIYKKFGKRFIRKVSNNFNLEIFDLNNIYYKLYNYFIFYLDANDNGIGDFDTNLSIISMVNTYNIIGEGFKKVIEVFEAIIINKVRELLYIFNQLSKINVELNTPICILNIEYKFGILRYGLNKNVKFIIVPKGNYWKLRSVKRKYVIKGEDPDIVFIHHAKFMAIVKTKEKAIQLAKSSC